MTGWRLRGDTLVLELHMQPGAVRTEAAGLHGGRLKVRVAALLSRLDELIDQRLGAG